GYGLAYDLSLWRKDWPHARFIADASASALIAEQFREINPGSWGPGALALWGTEFQLKVWKALLQIPPGQALSYDQVTKMVSKTGTRTSSTVNPLSMLVPCHRVMNPDGSLSGYRWGAESQAVKN
ncbi:MAG TPA: methylated-DNA--[protein]-cysteine S-methyltransferase, partial [Alphaproteobacteria bacterium]|nr:methylated-DNA--[protein]-cysteine S-methyltransferase [Alphaproteobacteria bacterium]